MSNQDENPLRWDGYHRMKLRPGTSFSVKQTEIDDALAVAQTRVGRLTLWTRDDVGTRRGIDRARLPLLSADWALTDTHLWIYAIPSDRRRDAHALMVERGLPEAARWLAEVPRRGNVWTATRHRWAAYLVDEDLLVEES